MSESAQDVRVGWTFDLQAANFLFAVGMGGFTIYEQLYPLAFFFGCMVLSTCTAEICRTIKEARQTSAQSGDQQ